MDTIDQPIQNPQPEPQVGHSHSSKTKLILIGLGVLFVLGLGGTYVLGMRNQPAQIQSTISPTLSQQKVADSSVEWKTFTKTKDGYSIQYPDSLRYVGNSGGIGPSDEWESKDRRYNISVQLFSVRDYPSSFNLPKDIIKSDETITISGQSVRKVTKEIPTGMTIDIGPIKHKNSAYFLHYFGTKGHESSGISIFDQMILTFKFIDQKQAGTVSQPVIPPDWKQFTDEDWQFGAKATMSLPPGFSFKFSGSEFSIQKDSDASEVWDYVTSISNDESGKSTDFYNGESRRVWYQEYLKGKYGGAVRNPDIAIVSTKEYSGYLEIIVSGMSSNNESHYLFVKNGIMNIIRPVSSVAYSSDAVIKKNIAAIISSVSVTRTK